MSAGPGTDDAQLVAMAKAGERTAFDALVRRFQRAVHAVAFAVVRDGEAALDILQESLIVAYLQLDNLADPGKFGPWVCGIARNRAKQYLRGRARRHAHECPLQEARDLATSEATNDAMDEIRSALSLLTEGQADTVALFYMEGYTVRECAHLQGVAEGTVKRRLHEARRRLRKELTEVMKQRIAEFALPEDYHVVIDRLSRLLSNHTTIAWFDNRWVMVWQDGKMWGKERWACDRFEYWMAESGDGREWTAPRQLELSAVPYPDARTFHLSQSFVHRGRLYLHAYRHENGIDLYSSADLQHWTVHPRLCIPGTGRSAMFGDDRYLYVVYPSWVEVSHQGDRVDLVRSADGGETWQWLKSPSWPQQGITDAAGLVVGERIYLAWRGHARSTEIPHDQLPQHVSLIWSDDDGASWSDPVVVEPLTIEKRASFSLCLASSGDTLVIAQEVWNDGGDGVSEIWATFSEDRGRTWPRKAVYSAMSLFDPSIAFSPDGSLIVAGSLRVDDRSSRPWFLRTGIRARVEEK